MKSFFCKNRRHLFEYIELFSEWNTKLHWKLSTFHIIEITEEITFSNIQKANFSLIFYAEVILYHFWLNVLRSMSSKVRQ